MGLIKRDARRLDYIVHMPCIARCMTSRSAPKTAAFGTSTDAQHFRGDLAGYTFLKGGYMRDYIGDYYRRY